MNNLQSIFLGLGPASLRVSQPTRLSASIGLPAPPPIGPTEGLFEFWKT